MFIGTDSIKDASFKTELVSILRENLYTKNLRQNL